MNGRTVLITGATGGIGREMAREFARHGYNLVLSATREERLLSLAEELSHHYGVEADYIVADLTDTDTPRQLYNALREREITVDILINNAGFGLGGGKFHEKDPVKQMEMIKVNIAALTSLCRRFIPGMVQRGYGGVVNLSSMGGLVPGPTNAVYCASKAYVLSFSEALSVELENTGVRVTAICPGGTATNFAHRADMETSLFFRYFVMHPREVAKAAYRAYITGKRVEVVGLPSKIMNQMTRLLPRCVVAKASGFLQQPYRADHCCWDASCKCGCHR